MKQQKLLLPVILFIIIPNLFWSHKLQAQSAETKQKVYLLGHAHMDPVYRWRWNEIENREIYKTFSDVLGMLDKYPDLQFSQSYLLYYESIQKKFPVLFEKVKKAIEGKSLTVDYAEVEWVAKDKVAVDDEISDKIDKLVEKLEEHDDVNSVYTNVK